MKSIKAFASSITCSNAPTKEYIFRQNTYVIDLAMIIDVIERNSVCITREARNKNQTSSDTAFIIVVNGSSLLCRSASIAVMLSFKGHSLSPL
jgi:hypothetical protein